MLIDKLSLARLSLQGLSIGDAFGENFWGEEAKVWHDISNRFVPTEINNWEFTDDTVMAIAVYKMLEQYGEIRQYELAQLFAENYYKGMDRGYGGTAHYILRNIKEGKNWQTVSSEVFDGQGSMGNGAAMRVAPLGAFFYNDVAEIIRQAKLSAEVTHFHQEAKVGAVAIALSAGLAVHQHLGQIDLKGVDFRCCIPTIRR